MLIGIDASRSVSTAPTGTEYYSRALIGAILRLDTPYFFRLYTRDTPPRDVFPATPNYEICAMPFPRLWTHLRLACEMLVQPPDALFVPAHVLPPIQPRRAFVTVHDLGYKFFPAAHPFLQRLYLDYTTRWNVRRATTVFADSYATRSDIVRFYGANPNRIQIIYPSYNAQVFRPVREQGEIERVRNKYGLTAPYVIAVGTVQPRKNYARLIEASAALPDEYSCLIVGKKGWLAAPILAKANEQSMGGRVRLIDYAPSEDLPALYAGAALAVFPSLYEGFGLPALEAQACNTPLVSSNSSSLPEVAGKGALYFDPQSIEEMVRTMRAVLENPDLQRQLVTRGQENLGRFSWERAAREVVGMIAGNQYHA